MTDWAKYIGIPWESGAPGPSSFDCWSFVRHVNVVHFGRELPTIEIDALNLHQVVRTFQSHPELDRWVKVDAPAHGDSVLTAHGRHPDHVGIWLDIDGGGVMHCMQEMGVVFQSMSSMKLHGWGRIEFYRFVG